MDNSQIDVESLPTEHTKFLARYASLLNEKKFGKDGFASEFGAIKQHSIDFKRDPLSTTIEGSKEDNKKKNRYKDILPFDSSRVVLDKIKDEPASDYINASYIKGINGKRCYIASQGPMPTTVEDFWRMICQFKIEVVVMACREIEMGRHRCQRYWPHNGEQLMINGYMIELIEEKPHADDLYERKIKVSTDKFKHLLTQFHFTSWPDHDAPAGCQPVLTLLDLVRQKQPGNNPPLLIHCSAGCGRTGAIIAVDCAKHIIKQKKGELNVFAIVMALRRQRPAMVQTKEQYFFLFQAIYEMISQSYPKRKSNIDTPMYANINIDRKTSPPPVYENLNDFSSYSPTLGRKLAVKPIDNSPPKQHPPPPKQQPKIDFPIPKLLTTGSTSNELIPADEDAPVIPPKSPGSNRKMIAPPTGSSNYQQANEPKQATHEQLQKKHSCNDAMMSPVQKPFVAPKKPSRKGIKNEIRDTNDATPITPVVEPVDSMYAEVKKGHTISVDQQSQTFIEVWSTNPAKKTTTTTSERPLLPAKNEYPDTPPSLPDRTPESFVIVYGENERNSQTVKPVDIPANSKAIDSPMDECSFDKSPNDHIANKQWLSAGVSKLKKFGNLKWTPHKRSSSSGTDTIVTPPAYEGSPDHSTAVFYLGEHLGFKCRLPSRPVGPRDPPSHWPSYPKWPVTRI